ncbi:MAG: 3-isopropylmalate dehydrogenase [Hyphomicrobiaceae bacterium]
MPGDGIGPEVVGEAARVADWLIARRRLPIRTSEVPYGYTAYKATGEMLPAATAEALNAADAILFGATGGPERDALPMAVRRKGSLLSIRKELGLYANLRPVKPFPALIDSSPLKADVIRNVDMIILRELNGGIYFGEPRGVEDLPDGGRRGFNTEVYTTPEIQRIARVAFRLAEARSGRVCSVDKANVMDCSRLWREEVTALHAAEFPHIELSHMYVDNAAMQIVRRPDQFDVIVTGNIFGDILSDVAAPITGSLGMLPSASLNIAADGSVRRALFEPVHGSAPDIAGKGVANPLGAILSLAMALRHSFAAADAADEVEQAVAAALAGGARTPDLAAAGAATLGTRQMGDAVLAALEANA